jgi:FAD/FMN-containing dehydrogenase
MLTSSYTHQFKYALSNDIPFSVKAGGMSNKNSVEGGLIINLSGFHGITVNASKNTVTLQSGVIGSQLVEACFSKGFCVGN